MLTTIAIILIILWLFGFLAFPTIGWIIHLVLVIAIILLIIRLLQGRNPV